MTDESSLDGIEEALVVRQQWERVAGRESRLYPVSVVGLTTSYCYPYWLDQLGR